MALFRCVGSSADGSAVITVTYDSYFYNQTMTCSNGVKTYTKTTTSSGSTTFTVYDEGTWTITCNGVSNTVAVVFNYSNEMHITKTFTIRSGKSDTVSFTDMSGSKTCTTNSTDGSGTVDITFSPGQQITFTSTVARDPDNIANRYSKTITLTDDTPTTLWIMPTDDGSNMIYWYGVILWSNLGSSVEYHSGSGSTAPAAASFNTNNIGFNFTTIYQARTVMPSTSAGYTKDLTPYHYVHWDSKCTNNNLYSNLYILPSKPTSWQNQSDIKITYRLVAGANGKNSIDISNISRNAGFSLGFQLSATATCTGAMYAVWLEE